MKKVKIAYAEGGRLNVRAATGIGENIVEMLWDMLTPDGRFKDLELQAEFEAWRKLNGAKI